MAAAPARANRELTVEWRLGQPPPEIRLETLNLAFWRASRSGLGEDLVHPLTEEPAPAETVVRALLRHIGDAVTEADDQAGHHGLTTDLMQTLLARGNGAALQRRVYQGTGDLAAVVRNAVAHTLAVE